MKKNPCLFLLLFFLFFTGIVIATYDFSRTTVAFKTKNSYRVITRQSANLFEHSIVYKNKKADDKVDNQVGFDGSIFDRIDFEFSKFSGKKLTKNHNISVSQKSIG